MIESPMHHANTPTSLLIGLAALGLLAALVWIVLDRTAWQLRRDALVKGRKG